jgi:hypothetical protein
MATHRVRRGARVQKGGGSEGLGAGASGVKRPSVLEVLIGALPFSSRRPEAQPYPFTAAHLKTRGSGDRCATGRRRHMAATRGGGSVGRQQ